MNYKTNNGPTKKKYYSDKIPQKKNDRYTKKNYDKHFFASCPRYCEELLAEEMKNLGIEGRVGRGGVSFQAPEKDALRILINSRVASRVYMEIGMFFINDEKEIYKKALDIKWEEYVNPDQTFKIQTILNGGANQFFKNSIYLSQVLKDALCDKSKEIFKRRPDVELHEPDVSFLQRIESTPKDDFRVKVLVDLCGRSLDKRGYRERGHRAPLRENLAAALVMSTNWDKETVLMDPMCGSGTILIEAILVKLNIPPSYLYLKENSEPYAFNKQKWFFSSGLEDWYTKAVHSIINNAEKAIAEINDVCFVANDSEQKNITQTISNLRRCFSRIDFVQFENQDFFKLDCPSSNPKVLIFNPPYGERLKEDEINDFYFNIGETLKNNYSDITAYIFTLHGGLRNNIRLKVSMKKEFFNGDLDCRLFKYEIN